MALRSGRFNFEKATNAEQIIIKGKKNESLVRIFNSGKHDFKVNVNGADVVTLYPSYSVDIAGENEVKIIANGVTAQGMYDYLTPHRDGRSGRFNTDNLRGDLEPSTDPLLVADLTSLNGSETAYYRFFNSGKNSIEIYDTKDSGNSTPQSNSDSSTLAANQSIDLRFSGNMGAIWVKGAGTDLIEGIYDFLDSNL